MAILGTILVSLLVTGSRLDTQSGHARQLAEACRIADRLIEGWWQTRDKFPRTGEGPVPGETGWRWRTRFVENDAAKAIGVETIAVELFHAKRIGSEEPAVRIDVLLPEAARDEAGANAR
jgi:hypothetical protein